MALSEEILALCREAIAQGVPVTFTPDGGVFIGVPPVKSGPMSNAEKCRSYRMRKAQNPTLNDTKRHQTTPSDTGKVSLLPENDTVKVSQCHEIKAAPLPPPTPSPYRAEAPASAHTCEAGAEDLFPDNKPEPAISQAKRIRWTPKTGWQGITDEDRKGWETAYPACDIPRQLSSATNWLLANPRESKKSNFARFINNWLSRSQEKGGDTRQQRYSNGNDTRRNSGPPPPSSFKSFQPPTEADKNREWTEKDFIIS